MVQSLASASVTKPIACARAEPYSTLFSPSRRTSGPTRPPCTVTPTTPMAKKTKPTSRGVRPSTAAPQIGTMDCRIVPQTPIRNTAAITPRRTGLPAMAANGDNSTARRARSAVPSTPPPSGRWRASRGARAQGRRCSGGRLSFRNSWVPMKASPESPAATMAGTKKFMVSGSVPPSRPPITGPSMKPRPKAAPIMPSPLARFSGVVTSAT